MIIQLAWRNLWRQPRRTLLSSLAITFTTSLLIFMPSMQNGSYNTMIENTLRLYDGYAEIQQNGYRDNPEMRNSIPHYGTIVEQLKTQTGLSNIAVRADGAAILSSPLRSLGAQVIGVQPENENLLSTIPGNIRQGRYIESVNADEIVMGEILAQNLRLEPGDRVTLLGLGRDGSLAADSLVLVGTFSTGIKSLDRLMAEIPLTRFQQTYSMQDHAHSIVINDDDLKSYQQRHNSVQSIASEHQLQLLDWKQLQPGLWQGILLDISSAALVYIALVIVVAFSLLNSILMSVLERTREFGVLLALGMSSGQISRMVWLETCLMLLFGLVLGMFLGYLVSDYYAHAGIHFEQAQEIFSRYGLPSAIYPQVSAITLLAGPVVISLSVLLAGLFPIIRIHRLQPVNAMRQI